MVSRTCWRCTGGVRSNWLDRYPTRNVEDILKEDVEEGIQWSLTCLAASSACASRGTGPEVCSAAELVPRPIKGRTRAELAVAEAGCETGTDGYTDTLDATTVCTATRRTSHAWATIGNRSEPSPRWFLRRQGVPRPHIQKGIDMGKGPPHRPLSQCLRYPERQ